MARPVWHDAAPSVEAVADLLQEQALATGELDATPRPGKADTAILHRAALLVARRRLQSAHEASDRILAQEVRAIDDLQRSANLLVERLREWYGLHAPEATRRIDDAERLADLVADLGDRSNVLAALDDAETAATSLGTELAAPDVAAVQGFAAALRGLHTSWRGLEVRVEQLMAEVAPNLAAVVGSVLGARMIAQAGGLERLATWPTGTVQLLGAETALFRHIKEGTKPPKHGILFQHPTVFQAPPWQRGAVARAMASAASTAAKADAFTRRDIAQVLREGLEKDLARIRSDKAQPPRRPSKPRYDPRGPPRGGGQRGPPRGPPRSRPSDGERRGPYRGPPRNDRGPRGPPRDDRGPRGPPRDDRGPRGPPRDDRGRDPRGPPRGPRDDRKPWPPKRKLPGAFRDDNKPARPPGK